MSENESKNDYKNKSSNIEAKKEIEDIRKLNFPAKMKFDNDILFEEKIKNSVSNSHLELPEKTEGNFLQFHDFKTNLINEKIPNNPYYVNNLINSQQNQDTMIPMNLNYKFQQQPIINPEKYNFNPTKNPEEYNYLNNTINTDANKNYLPSHFSEIFLTSIPEQNLYIGSNLNNQNFSSNKSQNIFQVPQPHQLNKIQYNFRSQEQTNRIEPQILNNYPNNFNNIPINHTPNLQNFPNYQIPVKANFQQDSPYLYQSSGVHSIINPVYYQIPLLYNPVIPNYPNSIESQINYSPNLIDSLNKKNINPYFKIIYNAAISVISGLTSKLLTFNIHDLENKKSIEHTQFQENFKKILRSFTSTKSISSIFPFCISMFFWEYSKKVIDYIFKYDEHLLNEKYLNNNRDTELYKNVYSRSFISSFFMGFLLSKPLNLFDSVILGVSYSMDIKGEKIDEKIIRKNINDGFYERIYNKLHNYSVTVYTLHFGLFYGFYETSKFFNRYYRSQNFFTNFKLAFYLSMITNLFVYPYELVRQKFSLGLIYTNNNKILESNEQIKKLSFLTEFKNILKESSYIFRDNNLKIIGYGMLNKILPSFFTAFTMSIYENYKF